MAVKNLVGKKNSKPHAINFSFKFDFSAMHTHLQHTFPQHSLIPILRVLLLLGVGKVCVPLL